MTRHAISALTIAALFAACSSSPKPTPPEVTPPGPKTLADVGLSIADLDAEADPCLDFYQFACGGWLQTNEIPSDRSRISRFSEIFDRGEAELKSILDSLATQTSLSSEMTVVRDYYAACLDEAAIEASGAAPLETLLAPIKAIRNRKALAEAIGLLHNHGVDAGFRFGSEADAKNAVQTIGYLDQGGLGLPDRNYYTSKDPAMVEMRAAYSAHVKNMFVLAGWTEKDAEAAAKHTLELETRLAEASKTRVERRDPQSQYNKIDRGGISAAAPRFEWEAYFATRGNAKFDGINVTAPKFVEQLGEEAEKTPLAVWRHYLAWHVINSMAPALAKAFVDESFAMQSKRTGQKENRPRWKRCMSATNRAVGEFLAVPFIEKMFPGESKASAIEMVTQLSKAFTGALAEIDWMSAATKVKAEEKRAKMAYLMGYPDNLKKYDFPVSPTTFAANLLAARAWEQRRVFAKAGKPTDRGEWYMLPQMVNAYYDPSTNQMAYPAGILQPPFFSVAASPSVNLGGMGMIVGHELTHGFDDQGSQYAANGNLSNWWQPEDLAKFKERAQCVVNQYNAYQPIPGHNVNGELTLGENIADIGGVKLAYRAHRALLEGATPSVIEGYSDDQRFFIAVGQAWCAKSSDERTKEQLVTDPHSPPHFRVNGALVNRPEFAEAFSCGVGTPMNPEKRCQVW